MKVTNINIQFENKQIIHSKCFEASSGLLTVIKGESGAGKTSLLNILGFKVEHLGDYVFEDHIVPSNEKKLFAFDNISYIEQNPHFIEDLTISEHIEIIKDIYSIDSIYDIIHDLEVDALLDKYPLQLSGGEKSRVALILGLLKEPNILLIDEPTASLDLDLSKKVIQFLKEYAHKGKIVIVASHDDNVIDSADCLYKIENKTLIKKYSNKNFIPLVKRKKSLVKKVMHLRLYFKKMLKHHKINKIFTIFLSCASIIFIVASSNLGSQAVQNNINYLNSLASKELIVFHPKCGFKELNYSSAGYEEPLTQQEFEKLSQIQHIKTIEKRFDCNLNGGFDFAIDNQSKKDTLRSADDSAIYLFMMKIKMNIQLKKN